jgi:hypothetical protein
LTDSPATLSPTPRLLRAFALLLMTIAMAIMRHRIEQFSPSALGIVIAAAVVMGVSLLGPRKIRADRADRPLPILLLLAAALAICFWEAPPMAMPFSLVVFVSVAIVIAIALDRRARFAPAIFAALLAINGILNLYFLAHSDSPNIDVYVIQKLGAEKLLYGENPFAMTFPDIYGPKAPYYPPGIVVERTVQTPLGPASVREVQCGYFYWPMSLLLALPGYLFGDVRYSNLAALVLAAAFIGYAKRNRISLLAGAVVLLCPGIFLMLVNAWLEPQLLMLMALTVFLMTRKDRRAHIAAMVCFGLLVAEKQYMILTLPLIRLMVPEPGLRPLIRAGVIAAASAAVVVLPFLLWDPRAFIHSSHALYVNLIRTDSVSILAWLKLHFGVQLPMLVTACAGGAAAIVTALRARRDPATFAAAMAFVLTVSFLFSTQAFLNYYFFATGCVAISVATADHVAFRANTASTD